MLVYFMDELIHIVLYTAAIIAWCKANDPPLIETRVSVFGTFWLYLFSAAWVVYGSSFMFSEEIENCELDRDEEKKTFSIQDVRITAKVLIWFGYAAILMAILVACVGCAVYALYKKWSAMDIESMKNLDLERSSVRIDRKSKIRDFEKNHPTLIQTMEAFKHGEILVSRTSRMSTFRKAR